MLYTPGGGGVWGLGCLWGIVSAVVGCLGWLIPLDSKTSLGDIDYGQSIPLTPQPTQFMPYKQPAHSSLTWVTYPYIVINNARVL